MQGQQSTVNTLDKNKHQVNIFDKQVTDKCGDRKHQENTQVWIGISSHFEGNAATEKTALIVNSKTKTKTKNTWKKKKNISERCWECCGARCEQSSTPDANWRLDQMTGCPPWPRHSLSASVSSLSQCCYQVRGLSRILRHPAWPSYLTSTNITTQQCN